ncbi:MAG: histidine--tRNA ligase [Candidatus Micrarchaeia archaeon]
MVDISLPRGTRDFNPSESMLRKEIIAIIEEVFKRFGFYPIETPSIETLDVLNAKTYGEESTKEIYKIEGENNGLIYDFTVPMSRYIAMNRNMPLPFKRYQIGNIWRKDEPQHMRYRQFTQADMDIVGSDEVISDAEVVAAAAMALDSLGIKGYKILINDRMILDAVLSLFNIESQKHMQIIRLIDKIPKLGATTVIEQIAGLGIERKVAEELISFLTKEGDNESKLESIRSNISGIEKEVDKFVQLLELISKYPLLGEVTIDLSLARGLDYYTSFVWEFVMYNDGKRLPTIVGGGRFDNLIGIFSKSRLPATGISLGIDRLMDLYKVDNEKRTYAKVFVAYIGDNLNYAVSITNAIRAKGIYTDLNIIKRSISKQLEYANSMKFKYTIIIGDNEVKAAQVRVRDMVSGKEELLSLNEAIGLISGE